MKKRFLIGTTCVLVLPLLLIGLSHWLNLPLAAGKSQPRPLESPVDSRPHDPGSQSTNAGEPRFPGVPATGVASGNVAPSGHTSKVGSGAPSNPVTLVLEPASARGESVELVVKDRRLVPMAIQAAADPAMPAPIQQALRNIAGEFADNVLAAAAGSATGTNSQSSSSTAAAGSSDSSKNASSPGSAAADPNQPGSIPDEALREASNLADERYRAFFGDDAFNSAGLQRAIQAISSEKSASSK